MLRATLFDRRDGDCELQIAELKAQPSPGDEQLLWIDGDADAAGRANLGEALGVPDSAVAFATGGTTPALERVGEWFWLRVVAASDQAEPQLGGTVLTVIAGPNLVVTLHPQPLPFLEALRERECAGPALARLSAESFVAALLDAHLATYFDAVADYEKAIEALENDILDRKPRPVLPELRRMRRWASRLRRMLAPHRGVFAALCRPGFRPEATVAWAHFATLDGRFERAMDMVENARELVLGSFELFSSQTALRTNSSMRILTFATVITGVLATVVGAFGMNFDAELFRSGDTGFWVTIGALLALTAAALALGRWRRWI